ncbi:MAG TPA: TSUP family transporter [Kofleriaceae bacterium]|nr:TSUP family transporter [Kofleriaceae bacterium]
MTWGIWLGIAAVALVAFATEGAIGFGGTVLAVSVGAQLVPLDVLLPAYVIVNLVLSSWLLGRGRDAIAWRVLGREVAPPVAAGAAVGLALFHLPGQGWLILAFSAFVIGLAVFQLVRPAAGDLARAPRIALLVLGGIAHGLFGTGGPMIVYVVRRRLPDKRAFRATLAVLWLVLNIALVVNFASAGLYVAPVANVVIVLAVTILPGLVLGDLIHHKLDAQRFERAVWLLLLAAGLALAIRTAISL